MLSGEQINFTELQIYVDTLPNLGTTLSKRGLVRT